MLLADALPGSTLVVAIDPGKARHRVWLSKGSKGQLVEPLTVSSQREGLELVAGLVSAHRGRSRPVITIEATGSPHGPWVRALEQRFPSSVRLFAPSETVAARAQLGSRRVKTDDRDCAALTYLARQGHGRKVVEGVTEDLVAAVRHRAGLLAERSVTQQHLHDQLNILCPGLSSPPGHGRSLDLGHSTGQTIVACVVDFVGQPPSLRSVRERARGPLSDLTVDFWLAQWKNCLPPPADAQVRAQRLGRTQARWLALSEDIAAVDAQLEIMLAASAGQVLTSLPGVSTTRAAAFAAFTLPIQRFPTAEHLYSATGLAPSRYQSSTIDRRGGITRTGLAEHRHALMDIAWGLSQHCAPFRERDAELRGRGMRPIQARVALARHACRLCFRLMSTQQEFDERRYRHSRHQGER